MLRTVCLIVLILAKSVYNFLLMCLLGSLLCYYLWSLEHVNAKFSRLFGLGEKSEVDFGKAKIISKNCLRIF